MASPALSEGELELELLRRGIGALSADADRQRCADCQRSPLAGELIYRYDGGEVVCELCRPLRQAAPAASERVRHSPPGQTVRLTARVRA